jgi:poly(3-hydroxybutyrate) depolymerase
MSRRSFHSFTSLASLMLLTSAAVALYQPPQSTPTKTTAAAKSETRSIKGDTNKRYFLTMPEGEAPAGGYKLLIVLPGGDGSANFRGFVKNIAAKALPPGYIVVQALAPAWTDDPERIVWPTEVDADPKVKFPTEQFIMELVDEVKAAHPIDPSKVFMLGWSSGGPPSYAAALREGSPVRGAFIAMSVFKPDRLPTLDGARGKAFYMLHSPQDFIHMRFPEAARDRLAAAGAKTILTTYEGGHGWKGDALGNIRTGVEWLEANSGAEPKTTP